MLTVGDRLPSFALKGVVSTDPKTAFTDVTHESFKGQWKVLFFWPKDFTFVCPTEIVGFAEFDGEFVHLAWKQSREDLGQVPFPMLADIKRELSTALGVIDRAEGVALRATFIVDPDNVIRFVSVNDLSVGRNPQEVLRVLDALQTDELCPCNWSRGEETLKAA
jgi:alkyl hydroperoxide reductase subunit AhpC